MPLADGRPSGFWRGAGGGAPPVVLAAALRLGLVVGAAFAGCAARMVSGPGPVAATDLERAQERTVLSLRAKNAGYVRQVEELENRIFILQDQLDSRKLAAEQRGPATLPVRTLRSDGRTLAAPEGERPARDPASASSDPAADRSPGVDTTIFAEHPVEYTGEASLGDARATEGTGAPDGSQQPRGQPPERSRGVSTIARPSLRLISRSVTAPGGIRSPSSLAFAAVPEPSGSSVNPLTVEGPHAAAESLRSYRVALATLRAGDPEGALPVFGRFLDENPQHDYADNAQYWIGECHYHRRELRLAERAFRAVVERYPRGNKVPDAMLKLGFTLQALGDERGARGVLESLAVAFPKHEAARLASQRLAHPEPASGLARERETGTFGAILPRLPAGPVSEPAGPAAEESRVRGSGRVRP